MRHPRITIPIIGLSIAAVAGGIAVAASAGGSTSVPSGTTTLAPAPATTPGPTGSVSSTSATLHTAMAMVGGTTEVILVDGRGLPLYFYKPDTATKSLVNGQLAALWPPLLSDAPTASGASGTLNVVNTSNGRQVAYNGHFLYTFVEDSSGHVTGQGVQNFYVATPGISAIGPATSGN